MIEKKKTNKNKDSLFSEEESKMTGAELVVSTIMVCGMAIVWIIVFAATAKRN